jgi:hypothetical protein
VGWPLVYLGLCRLLQLVVLLCRSERSKGLEILLLRPRPVPADLLSDFRSCSITDQLR